jgi:putative redox protein
MSGDKKSAQVVWRERMTFDAKTQSGHHLVLDTLPTGGGDNRGASPMELVLVALAGCTAMDVISILQKKREPVKGLEVSVEGTRADTHPRVYTQIEVVYRVRGNVKPKAVADAIALSEETYCSVGVMLGRTADITTRFEIEADEPA